MKKKTSIHIDIHQRRVRVYVPRRHGVIYNTEERKKNRKCLPADKDERVTEWAQYTIIIYMRWQWWWTGPERVHIIYDVGTRDYNKCAHPPVLYVVSASTQVEWSRYTIFEWDFQTCYILLLYIKIVKALNTQKQICVLGYRKAYA